MDWLQRYQLRQYVRNSIWVLPLLGIVAALVLVRVLYWIDERLGWQMMFDPDAAKIVLVSLATAVFTFIVYIASALLLAMQLASAQLTPRIIAILFRDRVTRLSLMLFAANFTFLVAALLRIRTAVPTLTAETAAFSCLASLVVFLHMVDHVGKTLRPSGVLQGVAAEGYKVIKAVYPRRLADFADESRAPTDDLAAESSRTLPSLQNGVLLAFNARGLVRWARRANCRIELLPQVGDYVAADQPLFRILGNQAPPPAARLHRSVALGQERTLQQDPAFAFRILVDIAAKGLSPAINDPTTAVLAIDQIHYLLASVGARNLNEGDVRDASGAIRLTVRTPDWEDFVHLAVTEVRQFGQGSIQVTRRLRAMLENLVTILPEQRSLAIRQQLDLLARSSRRCFLEPEDRELAGVSDTQGVGGTHARSGSPPATQPPAAACDLPVRHAEAPR